MGKAGIADDDGIAGLAFEILQPADGGVAVRWALYYALVLFSFAGLVMQNGGFAGGSFAYGGF